MGKRETDAQTPRSLDMNFASSFARALVPAAILAAAIPAAAATDAADLARLKAHISGVQTITADFTQTDARGRVAAGTLQLKRLGRVRFEYNCKDLLFVGNGKRDRKSVM